MLQAIHLKHSRHQFEIAFFGAVHLKSSSCETALYHATLIYLNIRYLRQTNYVHRRFFMFINALLTNMLQNKDNVSVFNLGKCFILVHRSDMGTFSKI